MCRLVLLCTVSPDPCPLIQDLSPAIPFIQEIKSCHLCSRVSELQGRGQKVETIVITAGNHTQMLEHTILEAGEVSSFFCVDSRWSRSRHFPGRMRRRWRWAAQAMKTLEPATRGIEASGSSGSHQRGPWPEPPCCSQCVVHGLPQSCPLAASSRAPACLVLENQRLHLAQGLSAGHEQLRRAGRGMIQRKVLKSLKFIPG